MTPRVMSHEDEHPSADECIHPPLQKMVQLQSLQDFHSLAPNKWGIPEPADTRPGMLESGVCPDLVFVPGVAFDCRGWRLGHGRGYYDRFLRQARTMGVDAEDMQSSLNRPAVERPSRKIPRVVALALEAQILPSDASVPRDEWDEQMDTVITASREWATRASEKEDVRLADDRP